jgi:hypothetical protein
MRPGDPDLTTSHAAPDLGRTWRDIELALASAPDGVTVAVSLRHVESGERHEHLGDRPFTAASTIKVLILIALARALDAGTLDLSTPIVPAPHTRVGGSGVLNCLSTGLAPTIQVVALVIFTTEMLLRADGAPCRNDGAVSPVIVHGSRPGARRALAVVSCRAFHPGREGQATRPAASSPIRPISSWAGYGWA